MSSCVDLRSAGVGWVATSSAAAERPQCSAAASAEDAAVAATPWLAGAAAEAALANYATVSLGPTHVSKLRLCAPAEEAVPRERREEVNLPFWQHAVDDGADFGAGQMRQTFAENQCPNKKATSSVDADRRDRKPPL